MSTNSDALLADVLDAVAAQFAGDCEEVVDALLDDGVHPHDVLVALTAYVNAILPVLVARLRAVV